MPQFFGPNLLKYLKKTLNGANFFLLILIVLTAWLVYLQVQIQNYTNYEGASNQPISVRIVKKEKTPYNTWYYYGWYNNSIWHIETKDFYELGKIYLVQAKLDNYQTISKDADFYEKYELSLGVVGQIKVSKTMLKGASCDLICIFLNQMENTKIYIQNTYQIASCNTFNLIVENLAANSSCSDIAALSGGLVLGGTQDFAKTTKDNLKKLGLIHIVAVSGLHIAILTSYLEYIFGYIQTSRKIKLVFLITAYLLLIFLVGFNPPVLRSSFSFILKMLSLFVFGRKLNGVRALLYSGLILLLLNSMYAYSISFWLSFLASLGILLVSSKEHLSQLKPLNQFKDLLLSSVASFFFTLPIIINISGFAALSGILVNLVVVPLVPFLFIFNLLSLIPFLGQIFLFPVVILQSLLIFAVNDFAPNAPVLNLAKFNLLEMFLYYLVLILLVKLLQKVLKNTNFVNCRDKIDLYHNLAKNKEM